MNICLQTGIPLTPGYLLPLTSVSGFSAVKFFSHWSFSKQINWETTMKENIVYWWISKHAQAHRQLSSRSPGLWLFRAMDKYLVGSSELPAWVFLTTEEITTVRTHMWVCCNIESVANTSLICNYSIIIMSKACHPCHSTYISGILRLLSHTWKQKITSIQKKGHCLFSQHSTIRTHPQKIQITKLKILHIQCPRELPCYSEPERKSTSHLF